MQATSFGTPRVRAAGEGARPVTLLGTLPVTILASGGAQNLLLGAPEWRRGVVPGVVLGCGARIPLPDTVWARFREPLF